MNEELIQHSYCSEIVECNHKLWPFQLPVPAVIAENFSINGIDRVVCKVKTLEWQCSIIKEHEYFYIMLNQSRIKAFNLSVNEPLEVTLTEDTTKYGVDVPECLEACLNDTPQAREYFEVLTVGKIRSLIHIVAKVKSPSGQLSKARAIVHHLLEDEGNLDFKRLNVIIKEYNQNKF